MANKEEIETFCPTSRADWRQWLQQNHHAKHSVWLVYYSVKSGIPSIVWGDAVEEALCFGWVDSKKMTINADMYKQIFSKRKPTSTWSKINKDKVELLLRDGLMTEAGLKCVEVARKNGSWGILDDVEALIIPPDLEEALNADSGAKEYFLALTKTAKKAILHWLVFAKQQATRAKRIGEIAENMAQKQLPKRFRT